MHYRRRFPLANTDFLALRRGEEKMRQEIRVVVHPNGCTAFTFVNAAGYKMVASDMGWGHFLQWLSLWDMPPSYVGSVKIRAN